MPALLDIAVCIGAYLLGSISSAILLARAVGMADPRSAGSGNPGATNMLRLGGKKIAALVFLGDMLKGLVPVLIAVALQLSPLTIAATGLCAFAGHIYPVFFGFKGGKGVATAFGVMLGYASLPAVTVGVVWLVMAMIFRISSLAAITAAVIAPAAMWRLQSHREFAIAMLLMSVVLLWRHRRNILNLIQGAESKIGSKKD
ncbi:MAG: glycerol-3-phosphate 1-O-acyltransferase PlsY [Chromatiales bacterium]|jgi:glycerol-3-phosphate acyltransferase PlsY|nr:glycerol-3-phosphate 1-O-acyltransferase PlsY [Chromatiales bacterium]